MKRRGEKGKGRESKNRRRSSPLPNPLTYTLIKEVFSPSFVRAPDVADNLAIDMKIISLRALQQAHSGGFRR